MQETCPRRAAIRQDTHLLAVLRYSARNARQDAGVGVGDWADHLIAAGPLAVRSGRARMECRLGLDAGVNAVGRLTKAANM